MKKIGILFGQENTFPQAFIERINSKNIEGIVAEPVMIDQVIQGALSDYAVIVDRISQDVPFYRAYLKNAAGSGTAVINNPFWWSADEKFFNNSLAMQVGVPVPKTVLLPSKERPDDTSETSFRNLKFPLSWNKIFDYVGFPAFMKPHSGGGWKSVYKVDNPDEVFNAYNETEQLVMMIQEGIDFESYFRCYCIGGKHVRVMHYEPRNPHHLRYHANFDVSDELMATIEDYVLRLNEGLGYDFNTVEFAVKDGIPYAIDFCNPAPDADIHSVGRENFEWVVETSANYAIERALAHQEGQTNLTWGSFVKNAVSHSATPADDSLAAVLAAKVVKGIEEDLKEEIEDTLADMSEEQIAEVMKNENIEEYIEEAIEEVIEEIEELFEEEEEEEEATAEADSDSDVEEEENEELSEEETKEAIFGSIGTATADDKDDLKKIKGVGPKLETVLNNMGIFTFEQVSKMTDKEYDLVDSLLTGFKGRGKRDDWAGQAAGFLG